MTKNKRFTEDIVQLREDFFRAEDCNGGISHFRTYEEADAYLNTCTPLAIVFLEPVMNTEWKQLGSQLRAIRQRKLNATHATYTLTALQQRTGWAVSRLKAMERGIRDPRPLKLFWEIEGAVL